MTKQEIEREDRQAKWQAIQKFLDTAKATTPDPNAKVQVKHPVSRHRLIRLMEIIGPGTEVLAYLSHVFATDTCTYMYEHMLWRLNGEPEFGPDCTVTVRLSKSLYAGD